MIIAPRALVASILGILAFAALAYFLWWPTTEPHTNREIVPAPGFRDITLESGITFRMTFLSKEQGERFKINLYDHGCGLAVADVDGDGFDDIYFTNQLGPNALYLNKGDGTFLDITQAAGVAVGNRVCVSATFADYDNDGLPDLYVASTRGGNLLFKNLGGGKFKNVTKEAGLELVAHCQTAVFFDYDNDGLLDLFVTCTAKWTSDAYDKVDRYFPGPSQLMELAASPKEQNILYRNNGNGTFTDRTAEAGLTGKGWGGDVAVFDFDDDGHIDLLVTNMFGASQLYRNTGKGAFTDVTKATLGRTPWGAIGAKAFDYNNDGKLDLLIVDMHSDMWVPYPVADDMLATMIASAKVRFPYVVGPFMEKDKVAGKKLERALADAFAIKHDDVVYGNTLFKNLGQGKFKEVAQEAGLETMWPWGIATGDYDNDGHEDVFLPSGMGYPFSYWPNRLLMNNGNETFAERSRAAGIEPPRRSVFLEESIGGKQAARSSRCAVTADFRNVGRLDIITNNFNDVPYYFQNQFAPKNYVAFRLEGTKSNRDAIGAMVTLHMGEEIMVRQVHPAGGYLSQSSRTVHFGLGDRTKIDRVEIRWPSGRRQVLEGLAINKRHHVIEPAS